MVGRTRERPPAGRHHEPAQGLVANVSQVVALDKAILTERVGKLSRVKVELVLSGIDVILGR